MLLVMDLFAKQNSELGFGQISPYMYYMHLVAYSIFHIFNNNTVWYLALAVV